ncbi:uncharacterized protein [Littorina saxatilis]|uniref:ZP domain-containing protein n=1 Tax=Littorina saxatilis TaxID=31220 RepID=A0AAN9B8A5_9CAEN
MDVLLYLTILVNVLHLGHCGNVTTFAALDPEKSDIRLEVVTASSDLVVEEAEDSTKIQLRASFFAEEKERGVSLYDCKAVSEDTEKQIPLTDSDGCPTKMSPMGCMVEGENGTVVSPVFKLSSLADAGHVNITCCWEICMAPHDPKCMDRCGYFTKKDSLGKPKKMMMHKSRRPRRDGDGDPPTPKRYVSTTIRVMPSHIRRAPHHPHHHRHHANTGHIEPPVYPASGPDNVPYQGETVMVRESSPLLYLNPITCSVFLLVLVVFLGLYVSFVRSLRHSVDDIKREIEVQRSRDKFLVH